MDLNHEAWIDVSFYAQVILTSVVLLSLFVLLLTGRVGMDLRSIHKSLPSLPLTIFIAMVLIADAVYVLTREKDKPESRSGKYTTGRVALNVIHGVYTLFANLNVISLVTVPLNMYTVYDRMTTATVADKTE